MVVVIGYVGVWVGSVWGVRGDLSVAGSREPGILSGACNPMAWPIHVPINRPSVDLDQYKGPAHENPACKHLDTLVTMATTPYDSPL